MPFLWVNTTHSLIIGHRVVIINDRQLIVILNDKAILPLRLARHSPWSMNGLFHKRLFSQNRCFHLIRSSLCFLNFIKFNFAPTVSFKDKLLFQEGSMSGDKHPMIGVKVIPQSLFRISHKITFYGSRFQLIWVNFLDISWTSSNLNVFKTRFPFFPYLIWSLRNRFGRYLIQ